MSSLARYDIVYELKPVVQGNCWSWNQGLNKSSGAECGRKPEILEGFGKTVESFPFQGGASSSPWAKLSDLFSAVMENPQIPFSSLFSSAITFQNIKIFFLKNVNNSHYSWIRECFVQPTAGKESSHSSSQKWPFETHPDKITPSSFHISCFFHKRKRKKENFWWLAHGHHPPFPAGRTQTYF